jgi:hypothetical protein
VLGLVCQVGAPILHLRNPGILIRGALPFFVRHSLLAFSVQPRQLLPRRYLLAVDRGGRNFVPAEERSRTAA